MFVTLVELLEEGFCLPQVEWRGDKDLGHDDSECREGDGDPKHVEILTEQPHPAIEHEQGKAGNGRRKDQREIDEGMDDHLSRVGGAAVHVRKGRADKDHHRKRDH
jgi:hypothetical protein